jgi:hypothetical protein
MKTAEYAGDAERCFSNSASAASSAVFIFALNYWI